MVTGRKPYSANTPIELSMQHLHDPIPKAKQFIRDLPMEVDQIIAKAIAKNPEDRFPNMAAFAQALEKLSGATIGTTTAERRAMKAAEEKELAKQREKRSSRTPILIGGVVLALLALAGFLFKDMLFPTAATATEETPEVASISTATPTKEPTRPAATATQRPPTSTPTEFAFNTSTPELTPVVPLQPQNVSRLIEVNRIDRISVIQMDWIPGTNGLIDAGSSVISFIDAETGAITPLRLQGIPLSMAASPENNRLYVLFNNSIQVIDTSTYQLLNSISPIAGGATSIAASPDGQLLALGISDNRTQLLNASDGSVVRNLRSNYGGWSVAFSPNSDHVVSGTSQGILRWVTATGLWQQTTGGQDKTIKSLAISHDGRIIAGGTDNAIFLWSMEDGSLLNQLTGAFGMVNSLDFSPDDSMLVSGSDDSIVRVWSVESGTVLKQLTGHSSRIFGVCFSPDGLKIASGAQQDGSIRIWGLP
jgi:DNA-binding beta-propeller fold protein YncE